jgi:ABC-2 type transport system permease protein
MEDLPEMTETTTRPASIARPSPRSTGHRPGLATLLGSQLGYQLRLSLRSSRSITSAVLLPVLILLALRTSNGTSEDDRILVAGALVYGVVSMAYMSHATMLVTARERGVLKRFRGSPLPPAVYLTARILTTTVLAVAASCIALELSVEIVDVRFPWSRLPLLLLSLVAGAVVWAALGTLMSGLIAGPDSAWSTLITTFLPLMFISGIFIPLSQEPRWLADIADWLPAEPFGDLVLRCINGTLSGGVGRDLLVLAGWLVLAAVLARFTFKWLPVTRKRRHATRKG